jgi:hypothetical protein
MAKGACSFLGGSRYALLGVAPLRLLTRRRLGFASLYLRMATTQGGKRPAS